MKSRFPGYFLPTPAEFDEMWATGLIVPDANILLHLLRYGPETRQQVLDTLRAFGPRVWVPYRVGLEFLRRWRTVDAQNRAAYEKLKATIRSQGASLAGAFNDVARHQVIDANAERAKVAAFVEALCASLDEAAKSHPSVEEAEAILNQISEIVGEAVGEPPTVEQLAKWVKEGQARYAALIPPGYKDASKKSDDQFGDYFIWEEMIAEAKARSLPVIFISDDKKEDWILRQDGQDIGPRPELVQEFSARTGQRFYSYPFRAFLERAKPYAKVEVSPQAIAEVEQEAEHAAREIEARDEAQRITEQLTAAVGSPSASTAISSVGGAFDLADFASSQDTYRMAVGGGALQDALTRARASDPLQEAMRRAVGDGALREAMKFAAGGGAIQEAMKRAAGDGTLQEAMKLAAGGGAIQEAIKRAMGDGALQEAMKLATGGGAIQEAMKRATGDGALQEAMKLAASGGAIQEAMRRAVGDGALQEAMKLAAGGGALQEAMRLVALDQEAMKLAAGGRAFQGPSTESDQSPSVLPDDDT